MQFTARDYKGDMQTVTVKGKLVHQVSDADATVSLMQIRFNKFVVVYGLQVSHVMDYRLAAIEYGRCIMHSLACASKIEA